MKKSKKPERPQALARLAVTYSTLSKEKRKEIDGVLQIAERKAAYTGEKRGPKPKHGETMTAALIVKCPAEVKNAAEAGRRARGLDTVSDYVRALIVEDAERRGKAAP